MTAKPSWLPAIFPMDGDWEKKIAELYKIFVHDFEQSRPCFEKFQVWWDRRIMDGKYPEGFWHITQKGTFPNRFPDFRRSERLPWCGPSITHSDDPIILKWDYLEDKGTIRTYLWLVNFDYVIILEKRKQRLGLIAFLITAYHVDGARTRSQLKMKYGQRI